MVAIGGAATLGIGPALAQAENELPPQVGDFLTRSDPDEHLTVEELRLGGKPVNAYAVSPEGVVRDADFMNSVLVIRFDEADLTEEAKAVAAEGVLAYSAICTHAGCEVSGWIRENKTLECPCHGSHFDPKDNGSVIYGPAARKLPQLDLEVVDGVLKVASTFDSRLGGDATM